jgi:hypothetical protein
MEKHQKSEYGVTISITLLEDKMFHLIFSIFACSFGSNESSNDYIQKTFLHKEGQETVVGDGSHLVIQGEEPEATPLDELPQTGTIVERHQTWGKFPEGTITLWLEAVIKAQQGELQAWKDIQYLTIPLKDDKAWRTLPGNHYFIDRIENNNPSFRSFITGAFPDNNYAVDYNNFRITIESEGDNGSLGHKYFLRSSGTELPRPISLKMSDQTGLYFVNEYSSMYVDVKAPVQGEETYH